MHCSVHPHSMLLYVTKHFFKCNSVYMNFNEYMQIMYLHYMEGTCVIIEQHKLGLAS